MKQLNTLLLVAMLTLAPVFANAQWAAVRFDSANLFRNIYAPNPNDVFTIGTDPFNAEYFLMRSDDGGTTWDSVALNTGADDYQVYEMHFPDATNGFIGGTKNGTNQNVQKSVDNGGTWTDITPAPASTEMITALYFLDANQGWATAGQTLYITSNGGANWSTVALSFNPYDVYFQDALVGYAAGGDPSTVPARMFKTTDGGQTWTQVLQSTDPMVFVNAYSFINVVDQNTLFTAQEWSNRLYRTMDAGATWDTIICDSVMQIVDFHFESADSGHVLSSMGQLYYTNDAGATWNLAYTAEWGLYGPSVLFYSLHFSQGVGYVCGSSGLIKRFDLNLMSIHSPLESAGSLNVFPSPCYGAQNITVQSSGMKGDCSLWIMNTLGEVVYFENIQNIESRSSLIVNSALLATGSYTVVLHNDVQKQTAKLIIAE
jgi:photosystem II stability/assembly factor-like uncharacterized protein